jgi:hypothetical protein
MYATIEADIENGVIKGHDANQLPAYAHVLITLLQTKTDKNPASDAKTTRGALHRYADKTLVEIEKTAWSAFVQEKHEQD